MSTNQRLAPSKSLGTPRIQGIRPPITRLAAGLLSLGLLASSSQLTAIPSVHAESTSPPKGRFASFVMENTVSDGSGNALSKHQVVFRDGSAFDLPEDPSRYATVIDFGEQKITLLDRANQSKATLAFETLMRISDQAMTKLAEQPDANKWGVAAEIQESSDSSQFSTQYGDVSYQIETVPVDDRLVAIAYAQFVDFASRLDLVRRSGPPPFARMAMHSRINSKGRLPLKTLLQRSQGDQILRLSADHHRREVSPEDERRINELKGMITLYQEQDLKSFPR